MWLVGYAFSFAFEWYHYCPYRFSRSRPNPVIEPGPQENFSKNPSLVFIEINLFGFWSFFKNTGTWLEILWRVLFYGKAFERMYNSKKHVFYCLSQLFVENIWNGHILLPKFFPSITFIYWILLPYWFTLFSRTC